MEDINTIVEKKHSRGIDNNFAYHPPKPITNADAIRSMTDEELAEELAEFMWSGCDNITQEACKRHAGCVDCWLDWLREAKDED